MNIARRWNRGSLDSEFAAFVVVLLIVEAFALPLGWLNAGRTTAWPTGTATVFWIGAGIVNLAIYEVATRVAQVLMKPWHPPLLAVLIGGTVLGTPFLEAGKHFYVHAFQVSFVGADLWQPLPSTAPIVVMQRQALNILLWVLINSVLVHLHGMRRFGYLRSGERNQTAVSEALRDDMHNSPPPVRSPSAASDPSAPAFMARVKKPLGPIWAMIAEEHYLRIVGEFGDDLILYRISDAAAEMEGRVAGARVHRSYWVASAAVVRIEKSHSGRMLVLRNEMRIPVSRGYQKAGIEAKLRCS